MTASKFIGVRVGRKIFRTCMNLIFPSSPYSARTCNVNGHRMLLFLDQHSQRKMALGLFERAETRMMKVNIHSGDVFLDIGANAGYYSILAAGIGAKVFSFDPVEANIRLLNLSALIALPGIIEPTCAAIADKPGEVFFDISAQSSLSRIRTDRGELSAVRSVRIEAKTIDSLALGIVNVVKIDVEGAEMLVLKGMINTIKICKPRLFMIELVDAHLEVFGSSIDEVVRFMRELGYGSFGFSQGKLYPLQEPKPFANNNFLFAVSQP